MRVLIVYASKGQSGKKIAEEIKSYIDVESVIVCLNEEIIQAQNKSFDWIFLVSPTYGDAEVEIAMENFLVKSNWSVHSGKNYSVCELGLYRGYEQRSMGAGIVIDQYLFEAGLVRRGQILSIDSVPLKSLDLVSKWLKKML
jgi:flavodoxin